MKNKINLNSDGFNRMMGVLEKKTGASYEDVLKGITEEILVLAAKKTGKSKKKILKESIQDSLSTKFVSSAGDKIRKARDGSLIFKPSGSPSGAWFRLRRDYKLSPLGKKNPAGQPLGSKTQTRVNRALGELRKLQAKIFKAKSARIASSQASFLLILKKLRIPVRATSGLGAALKAEIPPGHAKAVRGKLLKDNTVATIVISSKSQSALNIKAGGIRAFGRAFNGKVKAFEKATEKNLKDYVDKFKSRHGFITR